MSGLRPLPERYGPPKPDYMYELKFPSLDLSQIEETMLANLQAYVRRFGRSPGPIISLADEDPPFRPDALIMHESQFQVLARSRRVGAPLILDYPSFMPRPTRNAAVYEPRDIPAVGSREALRQVNRCISRNRCSTPYSCRGRACNRA